MRVTIQSIADIGDAYDSGRFWSGYLRRSAPAQVAGQWTDLSYAAGTPVANYYASAPLTSAVIPGSEGIFAGPDVNASGFKKYLHKCLLLPPATSIGQATFQILDVVKYYPFVDGDGGIQGLTNTISTCRYNGVGCKIIAIGQGTGTANGTVICTYTNSAGTAERVTRETNLCGTLAAGTLWSNSIDATALAAPSAPFLELANGDAGVRSIESVNVVSGIGGIFALAIVKPLGVISYMEATTNPVEVDFMRERAQFPEIEDGAYVSMICRASGSALPTTLHAELNFIWG
jgi:hypothetical protein